MRNNIWRSRGALVGILILLCLVSATVRAQVDIMPSSEVRAGMKGHGMTTLADGPPQRFDFEVVGVMRGYFPKGDMILIRMSGPVIDEAGIIAGMSGSPVYIDDKLVGAVAYGWHYSQTPLAGVTPFPEMMQVTEIDDEAARRDEAEPRQTARRRLEERLRRAADLVSEAPTDLDSVREVRHRILVDAVPQVFKGEPALVPQDLLPEGVSPFIRPMRIPVALGGPGAGAASMRSLLRTAGMMPVQSVARGTDQADADQKVEPGVPVGAVFISGDMDIAGMGTLTWTDGERVLAFGHPMFEAGTVDYPLALGHVQAVVSSFDNSFRLTSSGRIVGRISQDRQSAIFGRLDEQAATFPCKVKIDGIVDETYDYSVAGYWDTAPFFAFYAVAASSERWESAGNPYTVRASARIKIKDHDEPLDLSNVYTGYSVLPPSSDLIEAPLTTILLNPFRDAEVESIDYDLDVSHGIRAAEIESAWLDRSEAAPGSEVTVFVRIREYRGEETVRRLKLRIPEDAEPGSQAQILVANAMADRMVQRGMDPGYFTPLTFEQLMERLGEMEANTSIVLRAAFLQQGVRYGGNAMPALPESALALLQGDGSAMPAQRLMQDVRQVEDTPWVLSGSQTLTLTIDESPPYSP